MRRVRVAGVRLVACCTVVLVGLSLSGLQAGAAAGGRVEPLSPNPSNYSVLYGVSADSATDAWAVGSYQTGGDVYKTLILHWDGSDWSQVPSPNPSAQQNHLNAVAAVSPKDAWAVGQTPSGTLIVHWNGAKWSRVKSPSPGTDINLSGVAVSATSAKSAWAVGSDYGTAHEYVTLILHWNGTKWTQVKSPSPGTDDYLSAVSAPSTNNAWAVGGTSQGSTEDTLILHWNGTKWSQVKSFSVSGGLASVSSASSSTGWAVGSDGDTHQTIIAARSGSTWSTEASPNPSATDNYLNGVSAVSPTSAWAVGYETQSSDQYMLIAHWSGTMWQQVPAVNPSLTANELFDVSAVSDSDVWAVGSYVDDNTSDTDTLILHWDGTKWSQQ